MLLIDIDGQSVTLKQLVFKHRALRTIEDISTREWDASRKLWRFPLTEAAMLVSRFQEFGLQQSGAFEMHMAQLVRDERSARAAPVVDDYSWKTKPFQHQVTAFTLAREAEAFALLMEMGTGKTKTMIDVISWQMMNHRTQGALVLAPKAVLYSWAREIETHSPLPASLRRTLVITGYTYQKRKLITQVNEAQFIITNYETLLSYEAEFSAMLRSRRFTIAADESTKIKSHKSKVAKLARKLAAFCAYRYIMTGSPITQSPLDAWAQFMFLDPNILGHQTFTSFKADYAISVKLPNIKMPIVKGFKNLDRLAKAIKPHSMRVLKAECLDLPPKVYKTVELDMGPAQAELYRQMRDEAVVTPDPTAPALAAPVILTKLMRLQQITSGFLPVFDQFGKHTSDHVIEDGTKVPACVEIVEEALESRQKVIIWCRFVWEVQTLAVKLRELTKVVTYYGETSAEDRQAAVDAIQTGDAQVFIGQIQTGGMGITLTAASVMVYCSNTFSLSDRLQSEDRAHRIGQTRSVLYVDLVQKGTVDNVVLKAHREKKNLADIVTGDSLARILGGHF